MPERLQLPLRPAGTSVGAHAAALDLLAARLDLLASKSRWPVRVPLNSKASFDGDIVHTNEVKVHDGEGWIEMTAADAADYVRARKAAFLEDHSRVLEGGTPAARPPLQAVRGQHTLTGSEMRFDPLFSQPAVSGPASGSGSRRRADKQAKEATETPALDVRRALDGRDVGTVADTAEQGKWGVRDAAGNVKEIPDQLQSLVDLVGEHLNEKLRLPEGADEPVTTDEGLPIHEIRETLDGQTLGELPEPSGEGAVTVDEEQGDYWDPEAVARRAALRRRVFNESDTEDDEDGGDPDAMEVDRVFDDKHDKHDKPSSPVSASASPAPPSSAPAPRSAQAPGYIPIAPSSLSPRPPPPSSAPDVPMTPITPTIPSISPGLLAPSPVTSPGQPGSASSPGIPRKGILKQPTRKKSVSFDASVPIPPDSPPHRAGMLNLGFQMPTTAVPADTNNAPKAIPILNPPTPKRPGSHSPGASDSGSFGFHRGFLTTRETAPPTPRIVEIPPDEPDVEMGDAEGDTSKKKSLFAQRRQGPPALPKLAEQKPMFAMKTHVQEKAPGPPTVGTVGTGPSGPGTAAPSAPTPPRTHAAHASPATTQPPAGPADDEMDEDSDSDEDYGDLGDVSEDEYDLDDALLAREVALEYHRRHAWQRPLDEDDFDPDDPSHDPAQAGPGGVLMGIPRVSTVTGGTESDPLRIVNPTADDLSQFLRVGRADDGELVFEPPVVADESDSDAEDTSPQALDRRERRRKRHETMERLLRGEYEDTPPAAQADAREWEKSLPPAVGAVGGGGAVGGAGAGGVGAEGPATEAWTANVLPREPASTAQTRTAPTDRDVVERVAPPQRQTPAATSHTSPTHTSSPPGEEAQPPKKVSRFKAARQGRP